MFGGGPWPPGPYGSYGPGVGSVCAFQRRAAARMWQRGSESFIAEQLAALPTQNHLNSRRRDTSGIRRAHQYAAAPRNCSANK